jgi:hypothetical protein
VSPPPPPVLSEDEERSILRNVVIFKVLRFLRLFKKQTMDKIQNKEGSELLTMTIKKGLKILNKNILK